MAAMTSRNSSKSKISRRRFTRPTFGLFLALALLGALTACKPTKPPVVTQTPPPPTDSTLPPTTATTMPMPVGDGMHDVCAFMTFCDDFSQASPGGRGGDLDETKWSFSRLSQENVPSQGTINKFVPVNAEHCMASARLLADNDSFVCGAEFGESNHWMEALNDNGSYVADSARILQPFDFGGRTGTLDYSVDAKSTGGHGTWTETWLTDLPVQIPHREAAGTFAFPRNGIGIIFDATDGCPGGVDGQVANSIREIDVFTNYQQTTYSQPTNCFLTAHDHPNHIQIKVSSTHIEVWVADDTDNMSQGSKPLVRRASASFPTLPFTRGYWNLQHSQYNAVKCNMAANCPNNFTYHWHAVSFDGPAVTPDRDYQVPDALTPTCSGNGGVCGVNLGYTTSANPSWTLNGVDKTGAVGALLTYNAWYTCCNPHSLQVVVNGHTYSASDPQPNQSSGDAWRYNVLAIPLADLNQGSNSVAIRTPPGVTCSGSCPSIANIDLELIRG